MCACSFKPTNLLLYSISRLLKKTNDVFNYVLATHPRLTVFHKRLTAKYQPKATQKQEGWILLRNRS